MLLERIALVLVISAAFGLATALCGRFIKNRIVAIGLALFLGVAGATTVQTTYPVIFNHFFSPAALFEWTEFVGSGSVILFLPRTPLLMIAGFALSGGLCALLVARKGNRAVTWGALGVFGLTFLARWGGSHEHLPSNVETKVFVYRFDDVRRAGWDEQSADWVKFLDWNNSYGCGYESYDMDMAKSYDVTEAPTFVFRKEYWKDGKRSSVIHTRATGRQSYQQLKSTFHTIATARCTP